MMQSRGLITRFSQENKTYYTCGFQPPFSINQITKNHVIECHVNTHP